MVAEESEANIVALQSPLDQVFQSGTAILRRDDDQKRFFSQNRIAKCSIADRGIFVAEISSSLS